MEKQEQGQKLRIVEMARKRRHIYLLDKLSRGKSASPTLSKPEINELAGYENEKDKGSNFMGVVDSILKVARAFGVTTRTIDYWIKDGAPVMNDGRYDLLELRAWRMIKNQRTRGSDKNKGINWEGRFRRAKALLAELEYKRQIGLLLPKIEVQEELIKMILMVKTKLQQFSRALPSQLFGLDQGGMFEILDERIRGILEEFNKGMFQIPPKILENIRRGKSGDFGSADLDEVKEGKDKRIIKKEKSKLR